MSSALETPSAGANKSGVSPLAGKPSPKEMLVDVSRLERDYFERHPDLHDPNQMVSFGISGYRGTPAKGTFIEAHVLAITQAICGYRREQRTDGPLYMGKDTHALSGPAQRAALEVLAANGVETITQQDDGVTPTPVILRAILVYTRIDAPASPEQKAKLQKLSPDACQGIGSGRRADYCQADQGSRQRCYHQGSEGCGKEWLVCGQAVGNGEHLQYLH